VAFRAWHDAFPDHVEIAVVDYPGHGTRMALPLVSDMESLASSLARELTPWVADVPTAFFGHSMGGKVGYEVMRRLPGVQHFFASAAAPPVMRWKSTRKEASDAELVAFITGMGGAGVELLQDSEFCEMYLPIFRADLEVIIDYERAPETLAVANTLLFATDDDVISMDSVLRWRAYFVDCGIEQLADGGHFFVQTRVHAVRDAVMRHFG
jgi:surfactin synthase thioesterase subunit